MLPRRKPLKMEKQVKTAGKNFLMRLLYKGEPTEKMQHRRLSDNQGDSLWRNYETLRYLEKTRDDILSQVHQELANDDDIEEKVRSKSFRDVEVQSDSMLEQIQNVFLRLDRLAKCDHLLLETCVKIVDTEERRDSETAVETTEQEVKFAIPGRPKGWRQKCLDIMTSEISKRVKTIAPKPPSQAVDNDVTWLLRHLTEARDYMKKDLDHAKALSGTFTEDWDMLATYGKAYYIALMLQMEERFSFDLNHRETVEVLSWMIYCRDRVFNCQDAECKACGIIGDLQKKYLNEKREYIEEWMNNALKEDISDWQSMKKPAVETREALYTEFPIVILKILGENVNQAKDIGSPELYKNISKLCLEELDKIMESYTANAKSYISQESTKSAAGWRHHTTKPSKDRARKSSKEPRPVFFVQYSVALLNNFDKITRQLQQIKTEFDDAHRHTADSINNNNKEWRGDSMQELIKKMETQTKECSDLLLPKLFHDMNADLATLLTRNWLMGNEKEAVDTICDLMSSYLRHLREPFRSLLIPTIEDGLVLEYVRGLTEKRIKCEGKEQDRFAVSDKLRRECHQLTRFLQGFIAQNGQEVKPPDNSRWDVVREIAEVIEATDEETVITNMTVIDSKYPDIMERHAMRLLKVRGDFSKAQINKIVSSSLGKKSKPVKRETDKQTIFSRLPPL